MQFSKREHDHRLQQIGALARINSDTLTAAVGTVRQGHIYDLGLEINDQIPHGPGFSPFSLVFTHPAKGTTQASGFEFSAELISGTPHSGTHIDALIHVQGNGRVYGGQARSGCMSRAWPC